MHNGFIDGFAAIKRDLVLAVDESLFPEIKGQADTEVLFYLALTFGLADDPPDAVARAIGFVEACGRQLGITNRSRARSPPVTVRACGCSAIRARADAVAVLQPRRPHGQTAISRTTRPAAAVRDDARFVVSEPIGDLPGAGAELPEASYGVVSTGGDQLLPFTPRPPSKARLRVPS